MEFHRTLRILACLLVVPTLAGTVHAQSCTPQSMMTQADRDALVQAALRFSADVQTGNLSALRAASINGTTGDADAIAKIVEDTEPHIKQAKFIVDWLWLFDATGNTTTANSGQSSGLVDFYCALAGETDVTFTLHVTDPTKYAVAIVHTTAIAAPWQISFVMKQTDGKWQMVDLISKPLTAAGHDGLWYWTAGRAAAKRGESWTAWLYLTCADQLLAPMDSLSSTNREKLHREIAALHLAQISQQQPFLIDGSAGEKYSITLLGTSDVFGGLDVVVRVNATNLSDPVAARKRNLEVMTSLLTKFPELRTAFHGIWVFADAPGAAPYAIEQTMEQIAAR